MKEKILGVSHDTLERYTAVSVQTAAEMAEGSRRLYGTDLAVSTTGIAGPGGGTPDQPVGLVYTGISGPWGTVTHRNVYHGGRAEIKRDCPYGPSCSALSCEPYKESIVRRRQFGRKTDST